LNVRKKKIAKRNKLFDSDTFYGFCIVDYKYVGSSYGLAKKKKKVEATPPAFQIREKYFIT
jgi:hypothetical protein